MKRIKYCSDDDDDDDFEVVPYSARTKNAEPAISDIEGVDVAKPSDQRRVSPRLLVVALSQLNALQMKAVEDIGFGHLLQLQVESVPGRLVTWCLDRFQPIKCSIQLPDKSLLHISAEDVFLIFGFPKGAQRIDKKSITQDDEIIKEWTTKLKKKRYRILPSDVVSAMLGEADGGVWFKRLFLMLVETCLFENAADGYVKPKIMDIIRDLSKIKQYDWCNHMITALLRSHARWLGNKSKIFTGPSMFIVVSLSNAVLNLLKYQISMLMY